MIILTIIRATYTKFNLKKIWKISFIICEYEMYCFVLIQDT